MQRQKFCFCFFYSLIDNVKRHVAMFTIIIEMNSKSRIGVSISIFFHVSVTAGEKEKEKFRYEHVENFCFSQQLYRLMMQ